LNLGMKNYRHISERDRKKIAKLKSYKLSASEIARRTGFNKSTISRELRRNGGDIVKVDHSASLLYFYAHEQFDYIPKGKDYRFYTRRSAHRIAKNRRSEASRRAKVNLTTQKWITNCLRLGWSPQQIAGRSKIEGSQSISHEYVYRFIIKNRKNGGRLYRLLKRFGKRKQRLGKRVYQEIIPYRVSISERPRIVENRQRLGDLEGDLIVGGHHKSHILTVVDRRSRLLVAELVRSRKKKIIEEAFLKALRRMPHALTLTLDNAREFSCHTEITKKTGVKVYFADPYSSHQRGTNENTNGLIRYYFPKRLDFRRIKPENIRKVEEKINSRPRKVLNYLTAYEASRK
jgi:transposase, IS30 family